MSKIVYTIRRAEVGDEEAILSFRETIYSSGHRSLRKDYLRWKFFQCPICKESTLYIIESEYEVVGTQGYWPIPILFNGQKVLMVHLLDFYVLDSFKGLPAVKLFRKTCSQFMIHWTSNLSDDARTFFKATKWWDLSSQLYSQYYYFKKPKGQTMLGSVKYLFTSLDKKIKEFKLKATSTQSAISYELIIRKKCNDDIDKFNKFPHARKAGIELIKTKDWYKWRFDSHPLYDYQYAYLYDRGTAKAFLVFKFQDINGEKQCTVMDWNTAGGEDDYITFLLYSFLKFCLKKNITIVHTVTNESWGNKCKQVGFRKVPSSLGLVIHSKNQEIMQKISRLGMPFSLSCTDND